MKTCPQCHARCEDETIVCENCGYIFSASGAVGPLDSPPSWQPPAGEEQGRPADGRRPPAPARSGGYDTASLVLGIVSAVLSCCGLGLITGIIGLGLGIAALRRARRTGGGSTGYARAGIILSILAIAYSVYTIIFFAVVLTHPADYPQYQRWLEQINGQLEQYTGQ